jgi:hypothetical protein
MSPAGTWKKNQGISRDYHSFTYTVSGVGVESRIMDGKSFSLSEYGSTVLKVVCGAREHVESSGNFLSKNNGTYHYSFIRCETRGMDLHIGTTKTNNSSTLLVACGPPGIGDWSENLRWFLDMVKDARMGPKSSATES